MTTCTTCGQPIPEPVYVGPGDVVTSQRERYEIIGTSKSGTVWALRLDNRWPITLSPIEMYRTPDGRPIAGFKDPRDERIRELQRDREERNALVEERIHHMRRIDELEAKVSGLHNDIEAYTTAAENREKYVKELEARLAKQEAEE